MERSVIRESALSAWDTPQYAALLAGYRLFLHGGSRNNVSPYATNIYGVPHLRDSSTWPTHS